MRIATHSDRLTLLTDAGGVDVETASGRRFAADPQAVYDRWAEFVAWAREVDGGEGAALSQGPSAIGALAPSGLGAPAPRPRQVFAIGLNYGAHAGEAGLAVPDSPPTFTKFPCCITGPAGPVVLPTGGTVDWEIELVVVMGRAATRVTPEVAWDHVAGVTIGQDYSERTLQLTGPAPQFSLGKSFPGFGPTGPCLVTPDELEDPDDLEIECQVNGETVQKDRTSSLVFNVPQLIARLSAVCTLMPGDLIFTGTPSGVGHARSPQVYLKPGDEVTSRIGGLGTMTQTCVASSV